MFGVMGNKLLAIRISVLAWILFIFFMFVVVYIHRMSLTSGQLALFSVNTFLFGYYFTPLLSAQKARIAELISTARDEEMTILDILTQSHLLAPGLRHDLKVKLKVYLESIVGNRYVRADNPYYDELLAYSKSAKGADKEVMNEIYSRISKTQTNRDHLNNLFETRIYAHEWLVVIVLFGITLFFALQTNFGNSPIFAIMLAVLCTGLSLLMVILLKFATLTHKEAKRMWQPLEELLSTHFDDISTQEVSKERDKIDLSTIGNE
ncbi:MAG: hypothetical protein ACHQUB_01860 [Candidatus Saccharimonadia bacterium]